MYLSARHLSACLFHVSARGAIMAAATTNSRRLSQQNPYKTCVSLVELGQTSRHILVHFEKISTKIILSDVFLGDISFYLVLEFLSSFSSRSYPPVRKCTNYCGMNMSTNTALKTRTRWYFFDQSLRECNGSSSINMMNKKCIIFPDRVVSLSLIHI